MGSKNTKGKFIQNGKMEKTKCNGTNNGGNSDGVSEMQLVVCQKERQIVGYVIIVFFNGDSWWWQIVSGQMPWEAGGEGGRME